MQGVSQGASLYLHDDKLYPRARLWPGLHPDLQDISSVAPPHPAIAVSSNSPVSCLKYNRMWNIILSYIIKGKLGRTVLQTVRFLVTHKQYQIRTGDSSKKRTPDKKSNIALSGWQVGFLEFILKYQRRKLQAISPILSHLHVSWATRVPGLLSSQTGNWILH